jgi:hypothetical protein
MNCQRNVKIILPTQLPHKFSYIDAILIHNHFESPNISAVFFYSIISMAKLRFLVCYFGHMFFNFVLI